MVNQITGSIFRIKTIKGETGTGVSQPAIQIYRELKLERDKGDSEGIQFKDKDDDLLSTFYE